MRLCLGSEDRAFIDRAATRLARALAGSRWLDEPAMGAGRPGDSRQVKTARSSTARLPAWRVCGVWEAKTARSSTARLPVWRVCGVWEAKTARSATARLPVWRGHWRVVAGSTSLRWSGSAGRQSAREDRAFIDRAATRLACLLCLGTEDRAFVDRAATRLACLLCLGSEDRAFIDRAATRLACLRCLGSEDRAFSDRAATCLGWGG